MPIYTQERYNVREVVWGSNTRLRVYVTDTDGSPVSISSPTCVCRHTTYVYDFPSVTSGSGYMEVTMTQAVIDALHMTPWQSMTLTWGYASGGVEYPYAFSEVVFISTNRVEMPISYDDVVGEYPEIQDTPPQNQTSWAPQIEKAWIDVRNWIDRQSYDKQVWKSQNIQSYQALVFHRALEKICRYMSTGLKNSKAWEDRMKYHADEYTKAQGYVSTYFQISPVKPESDSPEPLKVKNPVKSQIQWIAWTGKDAGKL